MLEKISYYMFNDIVIKKMFKQIINIKNIETAYLDLVEKFDELSKSNKYTGIDGISLNEINLSSAELFNQIQDELINLSPIDPVLKTTVPKKDGTPREIFIYTVKERIKAQAIYRIIEPVIEENLSDFLFSYRPSHPHYEAGRSVVKRYKKYYGEDTVLISDMSDYTANIDQDTLCEKLKELGLDEDVINLCKLFIYNPIIGNKKITYLKKGILTGIPLIGIFANLYLNNMDFYVGKKVSLYRRVGDDFILFDKNKEKILEMRDYIFKEAKTLKLLIKKEKTQLIKSDKRFKFIGYEFNNKLISLPEKSIKKIVIRWKKALKYRNISNNKKLSQLKEILYTGTESMHNEFIQFIAIYRLLTDEKQVKELSETFFRLLTQYFFDSYSERNRRLTQELISDQKIPSLYKYYLAFHNGKKTISELSLSEKKSH